MCGRYILSSSGDDLAKLFGVQPLPLTERYNIAPTQEVPVVTARLSGDRDMSFMRWGLVPHWVKDPAGLKAPLFNARSETAADKPSFRDAMRSSRCLIPADGFYEWKAEAGAKQPYFIKRRDGQPMAFAGLYSAWTKGSQPLMSCAILTTDAKGAMTELHSRVPVILEEDEWERWLDPGQVEPTEVEDLLDAPAEDALDWYRVGKQVGNARVDSPELIKPAPEQPSLL